MFIETALLATALLTAPTPEPATLARSATMTAQTINLPAPDAPKMKHNDAPRPAQSQYNGSPESSDFVFMDWTTNPTTYTYYNYGDPYPREQWDFIYIDIEDGFPVYVPCNYQDEMYNYLIDSGVPSEQLNGQ